MELKDLLKQLRKEESPNQAAARIGISSNYYRDLERGYNKQRGQAMNPSADILKKIARAYKVDYNLLAEAAGLPLEETSDVPFKSHPHLHRWYKALPDEKIEDVEKLYSLWKMLKGSDQHVL